MDLSEALQLAFQHHTAGNLDQAEIIYQRILDADPNQPNALHLFGMLALQTGKMEAAVAMISKSVAVAPDNVEAQFHLGVALQSQGRLEDAVESYRRALELNPSYIEAYNNLGAVYEDLEQLEEAVTCYRNAISIKPDYVGAYMNLGVIIRKLGRPGEALAYYQKAIELEPDYAELHVNMGIALMDLAQTDEAVASFRKAISIKSDYATVHEKLGNAHREQGQLTVAIENYRDALAINPTFVDAYVELGNTFRELKRHDEAIDCFQKAIEIDPEPSRAHLNLANIFWKLEKFEEALRIFETFDTQYSHARSLECLFALKEYDEFYERQKAHSNDRALNLRAAAMNAFAANQLDHENPDPFCKHPLDFLRVYNTLDGIESDSQFLGGLTEQLEKQTAVWEPFGKTSVSGYQTPAVLFENPTGPLADLKRIVEDRIHQYRAEKFSEDCGFTNLFPETYAVNAWYSKLLKGGYKTTHIHPSGWLSGVFYLQVPELGDQEEGAIEFSLWGYGYPVLNDDYPRKRHHPKNGDLVLFPSSLFHGTIPFHTDEERLIVAFDVVPTG